MKLSDCLSENLVQLDAEVNDKADLLRLAAKLFAAHLENLDEETLYQRFVERESIVPTALGKELALPHARVEQPGLAAVGFIRLKTGLDWPAQDKKPVKLVIVSVVDESAKQLHLQLLARLSRTLMQQHNVDGLHQAASPADVVEILARSPHKRGA